VTATAVAMVSCFAGTAANNGRRPPWRVCVAAAVPRHDDLSSAFEILALGRRRLFLGQPALKRTGTTAQRIEAALRPAPHLLETDLSVVAATLGARLFTTSHRGLGAAAEQICFGKLGLPMLCSAVVGCTWLSGSFLSTAFWVLRYWDHRSFDADLAPYAPGGEGLVSTPAPDSACELEQMRGYAWPKTTR
jgi:hypothetical protein